MVITAIILVGLAGVLAGGAIAVFTWSAVTSKVFLMAAIVAAVIGAVFNAAADQQGAAAATIWGWGFVFCTCACCVIAGVYLKGRLARWMHRFVIYSGFAATFSAMAAAGFWMGSRGTPGYWVVGIFIGIYVVGSACIFAVKTLTIRRVARIMPDYISSLSGNPLEQGGQGYW